MFAKTILWTGGFSVTVTDQDSAFRKIFLLTKLPTSPIRKTTSQIKVCISTTAQQFSKCNVICPHFLYIDFWHSVFAYRISKSDASPSLLLRRSFRSSLVSERFIEQCRPVTWHHASLSQQAWVTQRVSTFPVACWHYASSPVLRRCCEWV